MDRERKYRAAPTSALSFEAAEVPRKVLKSVSDFQGIFHEVGESLVQKTNNTKKMLKQETAVHQIVVQRYFLGL